MSRSGRSGGGGGGGGGGVGVIEDPIFRLPPFYYMHVLDLNTNVTRVELGPKTYIRQDNERVEVLPERMVIVAPRHYCVIENPVIRGEAGAIAVDEAGQARLSHADLEIRLAQQPFPLYPGESLKTPPTALKIIPADSALRLKAILDFEDNDKKRVAGDEWLFEGPGTYIPRKEVSIEETVRATTIRPNQALKLRARRETTDREGQIRVTGEEWLVNKVGAYLPGAYEEVVEVCNAFVLTEKKALHVSAKRTFKDQFGKTRKNGEEWLVRMSDAETYIPDVYEEVISMVDITTLNNRQYCIIANPVGPDGKPQLGKRKLVKGEISFFLQPGESLEEGIQDIYVLGDTEGLILRANEGFVDGETVRSPGDRWMIRGPLEYVPPTEVSIVQQRSAIPLDENEGIYVRDIKSGRVRAVIGTTYLLTQEEELWEKMLPEAVEALLGYSASAPKRLAIGQTTPSAYPFQAAGPAPPPPGSSFNAMQSFTIGQHKQQQRTRFNMNPTDGGVASYGLSSDRARTQQHQGRRGASNTTRTSVRPHPGDVASFGLTNVALRPQNPPSALSSNRRNDEELWEKDLPQNVEGLLASGRDPVADRGARGHTGDTGNRDRTRVVTFRVPHNAAVQIYDYKEKKARVSFGPDLVMLGPDEHFTQLSLSGGKPKRPNVIKSLCLLLGPDFCTDIVPVETSDHARLSLQLSYNWHFESGEKTQEIAYQLFSVPDFIGDACKAIASRVRGMVAQVSFDDFHKNSARIIRSAVFGIGDNNKVKDSFTFPQNNLVVTSIDIQSVEPVDQRTRDSLQKSVQLAIEITTNSQEATARHEAERIEQEAKGRLERQKISDEAEAEKSKKNLLELQALSAAVESTGQAKAEAQSQAESARIEGEAAVEQARLKAEASAIDTEAELNRLRQAREAELQYLDAKSKLEVTKSKDMSAIEVGKFQNMVAALGTDTLKAIATAGPENQVKLLQGLGLQTALITDGSSPINLFQTAQGLIGGLGEQRGLGALGGAKPGNTAKKARTDPTEDGDSD